MAVAQWMTGQLLRCSNSGACRKVTHSLKITAEPPWGVLRKPLMGSLLASRTPLPSLLRRCQGSISGVPHRWPSTLQLPKGMLREPKGCCPAGPLAPQKLGAEKQVTEGPDTRATGSHRYTVHCGIPRGRHRSRQRCASCYLVDSLPVVLRITKRTFCMLPVIRGSRLDKANR